jgi:hypothetical protein
MKQSYKLTLDNEFIEFCKLNNIDKIENKAKEVFDRGFTILKFGEVPGKSKEVVEVVKEIIKEVPVEVIVEKEVKVPYEVQIIKEVIKEVPVEVIKEVPIEVVKKGKTKTKTVVKEIIKEVPVEKIVEVTKEVVNNKLIEELQEENRKLQNELNQITEALNKMNKARYMKNSDLSSLYDE